MADSNYQNGDVVQLRSGGPLATIVDLRAGTGIKCLYFNPISGSFDSFTVPETALKDATLRPAAPEGASQLRRQTVTKSSLS